MKNVTIGTTITPELNEMLEKCAKIEDRNKSQIVRSAVAMYLEAERNSPAIACTLVELVEQVNKIQREYEKVISSEDMEALNEKLAMVLAAEGR